MADDKVTIWNGGLKFGRSPAAGDLLVGNGDGFDIVAAGISDVGGVLTFDGPITVDGLVESTVNGFKFPDGTTQVSAAVSGPSLPLSVSNGGTGLTTLTANNVVLGNGASTPLFVAPGTAGNVLASDGTTWASTAVSAPAALSTASGAAPSYSARAWVNFNGTGAVAILASGNVSSITDNGTGLYTVNFTTSMPDANYAVAMGQISFSTGNNTVIMSIYGDGTVSPPNIKTTSSIQVWAAATVGYDLTNLSVTIFR
jgi:hypothetical protein